MMSVRKQQKKPQLDQNLVFASDLIYAVKHPFRLQILGLLAEERASAPKLSKRFGVSLQYASYHLVKCLDENAGLVTLVETRGGKGERIYELNWSKIRGGIKWPKIPKPFRSSLQGPVAVSFIRQLIAAVESGTIGSRADTTLEWRKTSVDPRGLTEINRVVHEAREQIHAALGDSQDRLAESELDRIDIHLAMAVFQAGGDSAGGLT